MMTATRLLLLTLILGMACRAAIAQEGLRVADRLHDSEAALRWLRRWHAVDGLPRTAVERWAELEAKSS